MTTENMSYIGLKFGSNDGRQRQPLERHSSQMQRQEYFEEGQLLGQIMAEAGDVWG